MAKKKILVTHLDSLFPKVTASQGTVFNMIKRLARDHIVDVATTVRNGKELRESERHLKNVCDAFYPIKPLNPSINQIKRNLYHLQYSFHRHFFHYPHQYFYAGHHRIRSQLLNLIERNSYDVVQAEYWYMAQIFPSLPDNVFKVIDTHDVCFDRLHQETIKKFNGNPPLEELKKVAKYRELEMNCLRSADMILSVCADDQKMFRELGLSNRNMLVSAGQDIDFFQDNSTGAKDDFVLFYGNMGREHNITAFFRFWNDIFPKIRELNPRTKLLVVGDNPPESIRSLADADAVVVTGFVDNVRDYFSKAKVAVLPLDAAAGFRSRTIEIMAMGIPVVGTHRALDSVQMEHGRHGFISDDDQEIAHLAAKLLVNESLRLEMGRECRNFVTEKYSIEATIGKLSEFYLNLEAPYRSPAVLATRTLAGSM